MGLVAALLIVKEPPVNSAVPSGNGNMFFYSVKGKKTIAFETFETFAYPPKS